MRCLSCDHDNGSERRFCGECGAALAAVCSACGAANGPSDKFCGGCGTRLGSEASAVVATPPVPQLDALPEGERRQLTVIFCDLVGSTPLSQQLDAEEWRELIAKYQSVASSAVLRFGGHVAKNLGDGLLIYFGWPTAREDDPERAVRAGLAIVDEMEPLNAELAAGEGTRLQVRIGMHTGPVVIADGGEVFGETANLAARVQGAAEPDTVVVTAATQHLVAGMFVVEDCGPHELKGIREPVTLYRIVQTSGVRSRLDVAAGRLTQFVGRDMELGTLVDRWERAEDGEGQNVVIIGEAGVGKSRLVYQLHEHLTEVPHTWLECGATPYTERTPFHPVIALTTQGLAFTPEDSVREQLAKIENRLGALASTENVALIAEFLGLPPPAELQLSPEQQRRKTIDLLVQSTLSLSATQPLVVFVEDLHWCDASTLELLGQLIAQSPTARMLILATARPEFTPPWPARSNLTTVQLARLTKRQSRDMIATLAGADLPAATLDALVARADGVPLYVEELTKVIAEPGAARGVEAIPASLADSLMGRLDRLSTAKEVGQRAAVLGREFGYPLLAAVVGMDEAALRHGLERLVEAEILYARGEPPAATYTFKHALIQETAYQSLLKRTRHQLHARIAQVLEERFPDRVAAEPELTARHWTDAGESEPAIAAWRRAGDAAFDRHAFKEAVEAYRRALAILRTLPESPRRDSRELQLTTRLEQILHMTRGWATSEADDADARAQALAENSDDLEQLAIQSVGTFAALVARGQLPAANAVADHMLELAAREGSPVTAGLAHGCQLSICCFRGKWADGEQHFLDGAGLFEVAVLKAPSILGTGYCYGSWVAWMRGHAETARDRIRQGIAGATSLQSPFELAHAQYLAAIQQLVSGQFAEALAMATAALALSNEHGFEQHSSGSRIILGLAEARLGQLTDGMPNISRGMDAQRESGVVIGMAIYLNCIAVAQSLDGKVPEALATIQKALDVNPDELAWRPESIRIRGELSRQLGRAEAAEADFRAAIALAQQLGAKAWELRAVVDLARLLGKHGDRSEARDLLNPLYASFSEGFETTDLIEAATLLEELQL